MSYMLLLLDALRVLYLQGSLLRIVHAKKQVYTVYMAHVIQ